MKLTVEVKDDKARLDKFLTARLKHKTRSQIKKMITHGLVEVEGKAAKVHQFLKPGQKIIIHQGTQTQPSPSMSDAPAKLPEPVVIFETKDYVILDKPAGLLVHPTEKKEANTLADWVLKKYPQMRSVGQHDYRAGIIHRLDKDVSGAMVAVKNAKTFTHLKAQFKKREVYKEYTAMVYGRMEEMSGEIDLPIGRNKAGQFVAHPLNRNQKLIEGDKLAKTLYTVLEYLKDYSLLKVNILTGRTHQIRVHLSAIGHPILGDQIYKPKKTIFTLLRTRIKVVDPGRIFLHSTKLGFKDLDNKWQEFESPLPPILIDFINAKKTKS